MPPVPDDIPYSGRRAESTIAYWHTDLPPTDTNGTELDTEVDFDLLVPTNLTISLQDAVVTVFWDIADTLPPNATFQLQIHSPFHQTRSVDTTELSLMFLITELRPHNILVQVRAVLGTAAGNWSSTAVVYFPGVGSHNGLSRGEKVEAIVIGTVIGAFGTAAVVVLLVCGLVYCFQQQRDRGQSSHTQLHVNV